MAATKLVERAGLSYRRIMPHERHICRNRCPTISHRGRCNRPIKWITKGKTGFKNQKWCLLACDKCMGVV